MTTFSTCWLRVTAHSRCAICGRADWCMVSKDGSAAICARVSSNKPVGNKGAGWLHVLRNDRRRQICAPAIRAAPQARDAGKNMAALADLYSAAVDSGGLASFAASLGVSVLSLQRLNIGYKTGVGWAFPMVDASGTVLGIRLRSLNGRKFSERGGHEGLFVPTALDAIYRLIVCEGPTDCAAILDLGLNCIGRPSCCGGIALLVDLVRRCRAGEVLILADGDTAGQQGAKRLAEAMELLPIDLRIVTPPAGIKDAREWKRQGASATDVLSAPAQVFPHHAIRRARRHAIEHLARLRRA